VQFFQELWGKEEGLVCVTYSTGGRFADKFYNYPRELDKMLSEVSERNARGEDCYFVPSFLSFTSRKKSAYRHSTVAWIDLDGGELSKLSPTPSLVVETSPDHYHAYWKLDEPVSKSELEELNKGLASHNAADMSGWDATQLLRIPGTKSIKRGCDVVVAQQSDVSYLPANLPRVIKETVTVERPQISLERALLAVPPDEKLSHLILYGGSPDDRSGALYNLACRLGETGVDIVYAEQLLRFADSRWGKFFERDDADERLDALLEATRTRLVKTTTENYTPITVEQLLTTAPEVTWLIDQLVAEATIVLISGGTGVGKSQLALQLSLCIAAGQTWLNYAIPQPRSVVYSSVEMSHTELARFLGKMVQSFPLENLPFHVVPVGQSISILTEDGKAFYRSLAEQYDVIVIDTLGASTHLSLSDEEGAREMVDFLGELRTKYDCTIIVVAHDAKNTNGQRTENVYGSRLFVDRASTVLRMYKDKDAGLILEFSKIRLAPEPQPYALERTENLWYVTKDFDSRATVVVRKGNGPTMGSGAF
jgi:hypothetical protein